MSKDIWHKAGFHEAIDDKLKVSKDGKWVYWTMYGWNIPGKDAHDIGCEWVYLDDLLALETELEHTRKALDVANEKLKHCVNMTVEELDELKGNLLIAWNALSHFSKDPIANNALKKITTPKQKDVK